MQLYLKQELNPSEGIRSQSWREETNHECGDRVNWLIQRWISWRVSNSWKNDHSLCLFNLSDMSQMFERRSSLTWEDKIWVSHLLRSSLSESHNSEETPHCWSAIITACNEQIFSPLGCFMTPIIAEEHCPVSPRSSFTIGRRYLTSDVWLILSIIFRRWFN